MIKSKKIISIAAAAVLSFSTLAISGCKAKGYQGENMEGFVAGVKDDVSSNGGFVVEKGDYVYFINGQEASTANNTYGKVVKGALMRISKADLAAGKGEEAKIVVPSLLVSGSYDSGIYIYGDYVYYATPTTDKDKAGQVANSSLDFKRAKLDGSQAPMDGKNDYFFRLSSNTVKYRFVEENGEVYCLYEEDSKLKSYSVSTGKTTVLVAGVASGSFFYDVEDLSSPVVYYAMSVTKGLDEANSNEKKYNQIFSVSAGNTVEVDAATASYKAKNAAGDVIAAYDFDEEFLKKNAKEKGYDLNDYTTYPYVNLGQLVLDGIGSTHDFPSHVVMTDEEKAVKANAKVGDEIEQFGYVYTLQQQTNGGLYFTRALAHAANEEAAKLCYIPNARSEWNAIIGNGKGKTQTVATDTEAASASALYEIGANGEHTYVYLADSVLKRTTTDADGKAKKTVVLVYKDVADVTLWKIEGDYVYYYGAGTNGKSVSRVYYKGETEDYGYLSEDKVKYSPVTIPLVDFSDSWYKPETVSVNGESILLYPNARSYGVEAESYNYIYAAKLGSNQEIKDREQAIEDVNEVIDEYENDSDLQALMKCYFSTKGGATFDTDEEVREMYTATQVKEFEAFKEKFGEGKEFYNKFEENFVYQVGRTNETDEESIADAWANYLLQETTAEEEEKGLETWAIVLIVCGSVLVVAAAILIPVLVCAKRKKARKAKEQAIVSAYKRKKIDTTDDKSIDVYTDEETPVQEEETAEEGAETEAPVQEGEETSAQE